MSDLHHGWVFLRREYTFFTLPALLLQLLIV